MPSRVCKAAFAMDKEFAELLPYLFGAALLWAVGLRKFREWLETRIEAKKSVKKKQ